MSHCNGATSISPVYRIKGSWQESKHADGPRAKELATSLRGTTDRSTALINFD